MGRMMKLGNRERDVVAPSGTGKTKQGHACCPYAYTQADNRHGSGYRNGYGALGR